MGPESFGFLRFPLEKNQLRHKKKKMKSHTPNRTQYFDNFFLGYSNVWIAVHTPYALKWWGEFLWRKISRKADLAGTFPSYFPVDAFSETPFSSLAFIDSLQIYPLRCLSKPFEIARPLREKCALGNAMGQYNKQERGFFIILTFYYPHGLLIF